MKTQVIINNKSYFLSNKALEKIEAIAEDDLQQQEINQSIWESFNKSEQQTYNNKLSSSWKLPQEKNLLFSTNK